MYFSVLTMIKRRLLSFFCIVLMFVSAKNMSAQSNNIAIVLNEYCVSNTGGFVDNYGQTSDWVEIYNAHTSSVTLNGYYLSNDRTNLRKWQFPSNFVLGVGGYGVVWLSGRGIATMPNPHANFNIEQSKDQWLILTSPEGAIRDSVFVQRTKIGHVRGRVDYNILGIKGWKLYTQGTPLYANATLNNFTAYVPTPKMFNTQIKNIAEYTVNPNAGGFYDGGGQEIFFRLNNRTYDTTYFPCYNIYYTLNGNYPVPNTPGTTQYFDSLNSKILLDKTSIIRAIAVPNPSNALLCSDVATELPSFCETNTYFTDAPHQTFSKEFGVVSIALERTDSVWFASQGNPATNTIHIEYYDNKKQVSEGYAFISRPVNEQWQTAQVGYHVTIDDRYGFGSNFEGKIFNVDSLGTSSRTIFPTLHLKAGDIESHSRPLGALGTATSFGTAVRDVFIQSLAAKYDLNVSPLHIKPVITFMNGVYVGVNDLREVYDKFYENYYNGQPLDNQDLCFYHNGEGFISYPDGSRSETTKKPNFRAGVFDRVIRNGLGNAQPTYTQVMAQFDKSSFMDYMIINTFAMNSNLWNYNVALARGGDATKPGNKWHYYLWNMPATFQFTAVTTNTMVFNNPELSLCHFQNFASYPVSPMAFNGHGYILNKLMSPTNGNPSFQLEYRNRFQDLLNTAFKRENLEKHYNYIYNLYLNEMKCHEDPGCPAGVSPFNTVIDQWDSNMVKFNESLFKRVFFAETAFSKSGCFGLTGPHNITVKVEPEGAGNVKLNTLNLKTYPWSGKYFATQLSLKAVSSNTAQYRFHHWEVRQQPNEPRSLDSITVFIDAPDDIIAVFTDITKDINNTDYINIPNGFSPNGDGLNERFRPLGSGEYVTEYEMSIWSRWGQEMYRSTDPKSEGWDGNFKGQPAVTGVYAYVISYKNAYGENKLLKGNVTLTR